MTIKDRQFKIGSLFSGSGGFELAASICGIKPIWASEIELYPIKVTKARFPNMKHYGDISKINGADLEPVDLVTGGSPCQSLSVAGKRDGMSKKCLSCGHKVLATDESEVCPECNGVLAYTRSGLFMEQIRVIKEMRKADELRMQQCGKTEKDIRPRFMLWENVTGAFSSNKGEDFRAVLEETARIIEKTAVVPRPTKGKWSNSGIIMMGDGYSIAWRVLDAQFWGVPQRRRRIALVADFAGQCAGEILFKRDGLQRNFTESRKAWQNLTGCSKKSLGETGQYSIDFGRTADRIQMNPDKSVTLIGTCGGTGAKTGLYCLPQITTLKKTYGICSYGSNSMLSNNPNSGIYEADTSRTLDLTGGNPACNQGGIAICEPIYCMATQQGGAEICNDLSPTITAAAGMSGNNQPVINQPKAYQIYCVENSTGRNTLFMTENVSPTLAADTHNHACCVIEGNGSRPSHKGDGYKESDIMYTLNATEKHAVCYQNVTGPLAASDYKWPQNQQVDENKFVVEEKSYWDGSQICGTLTASNANGSQRMPDKDNFNAVIEEKTYQDKSGTLMASGYNKLGTQEAMNDMFVATEYIVRRLTPLECSRLQGFPDWWTDGIEISEPDGHDIAFWREVFETHRKVVTGASKPKTDKQIIKWLKETDSDGPKYKLWGNGIALPCFLYVMEGIKEVLERRED